MTQDENNVGKNLPETRFFAYALSVAEAHHMARLSSGLVREGAQRLLLKALQECQPPVKPEDYEKIKAGEKYPTNFFTFMGAIAAQFSLSQEGVLALGERYMYDLVQPGMGGIFRQLLPEMLPSILADPFAPDQDISRAFEPIGPSNP